MKCLSLYQPWATLIATGWKTVETRDWYTPHRGTLAIHAANKRDIDGKLLHASNLQMFAMRVSPTDDVWIPRAFNDLPFGAIVATCELAACIPTALVRESGLKLKQPFRPAHGWEIESLLGNYAAGRWAWILRDVRPVDPPKPLRGQRKLFNIPFLFRVDLQAGK